MKNTKIKKHLKRVFAKFDENGILKGLSIFHHDGAKTEDDFEEITDKSLMEILKVNEYKRVNGQIVKLSDEEINKLSDFSVGS